MDAQAFGQCRKWIENNMKGVELVSVSSTAYAAKFFSFFFYSTIQNKTQTHAKKKKKKKKDWHKENQIAPSSVLRYAANFMVWPPLKKTYKMKWELLPDFL